jgi:hypothetical protein
MMPAAKKARAKAAPAKRKPRSKNAALANPAVVKAEEGLKK